MTNHIAKGDCGGTGDDETENITFFLSDRESKIFSSSHFLSGLTQHKIASFSNLMFFLSKHSILRPKDCLFLNKKKKLSFFSTRRNEENLKNEARQRRQSFLPQNFLLPLSVGQRRAGQKTAKIKSPLFFLFLARNFYLGGISSSC